MRIMGESLLEEVKNISGENPELCISCGRCTAACPFSKEMDVKPHQIVHLVRINDESVVNSKAIWVCVSCMMCTSRCPRQINVVAIIEAVRLINLRRRREAVDLRKVKELKVLPPIALVGAGRKYTG